MMQILFGDFRRLKEKGYRHRAIGRHRLHPLSDVERPADFHEPRSVRLNYVCDIVFRRRLSDQPAYRADSSICARAAFHRGAQRATDLRFWRAPPFLMAENRHYHRLVFFFRPPRKPLPRFERRELAKKVVDRNAFLLNLRNRQFNMAARKRLIELCGFAARRVAVWPTGDVFGASFPHRRGRLPEATPALYPVVCGHSENRIFAH